MFNDKAFIADAKVTESVPDTITFNSSDISTMKAILAAVELADQLKKKVFYGREVKDDVVRDSSIEAMTQLFASALPSDQDFTITNKEHIRICHSILGMVTESGELIKVFMDIISNGDYDRINFLEELGDAQWYTGTALDATNATYQTLFDLVIAKLKKRYPNGKFESDRAINRDTVEEYRVMTDQTK